jgi:hypothetical protein
VNAKQIRERLDAYLVAELPNGEWDARCPLHKDNKRSARFNFEKGLWKCFAGCGSGRLSGLIRRMDGEAVRREGSSHSGHSDEQSDRSKQAAAWHRALLGDADVQDYLYAKRAIGRSTIEERNLGWDQARQAFTIPIYGEDGKLINVRMYRPDATSDRKIWWAWKKEKGEQTPLYPVDALESPWVVIAEGEMDALISLQHGIPAVTGTAGAGTWQATWSKKFKGKDVFIVYDRDEPGTRGAQVVAQSLEAVANRIWITTVPINKRGADISDFFDRGNDGDDFKKMLRKRSVPFEQRSKDPAKMRAKDVSIRNSFAGMNVGRLMRTPVQVVARSASPHTIPQTVELKCNRDADPKLCAICPMFPNEGRMTLEVPKLAPENLQLLRFAEQKEQETFREMIGIPKCNRLSHEVTKYATSELIRVRDESLDRSGVTVDHRSVYTVDAHDTKTGRNAILVGTTWPDPKTAENIFLASEIEESGSDIDDFQVTPEVVQRLRRFRPAPSQDPLQKLNVISHDLEAMTHIFGRVDVHMAVFLSYTSLLRFAFRGMSIKGWLDILVLGDTRTGKTEITKSIPVAIGLGERVNCEIATRSGILGGIDTINNERVVTWGYVPLNDQGLVILDEISSLSHDQIQELSDARSSGEAQMPKIVKDVVQSRTRLVMTGNPRDSQINHFTYPIQAIVPLMGNPEDIARFDFMAVAKRGDVPQEKIQQRSERKPRFHPEDFRELILWAWSRTEDDVIWRQTAEEEAIAVANRFGERFAIDPPLVQIENVHHKVARVAASIASALFSTNQSGRKVIIRKEHVEAAEVFMDRLYQKIGLKELAEQIMAVRAKGLKMIPESERFLRETEDMIPFMKSLRTNEFRDHDLQMYLHLSQDMTSAVVSRMFQLGLIVPNSGGAELTEVMHTILRGL